MGYDARVVTSRFCFVAVNGVRLPRRGWSLVIYDKSLGRALGRTSSRLPGRRRQAEEAGGVLPHELLRRLLAERLPPRDHGLGMVGIDRLRVRVIRLEHEDVIAEDVDHRAGQLDVQSMPQKTRPIWAYSTGVCFNVGDTEPRT